MIAGDVIYFVNFRFQDGTTRDKLLIILNTPKDNEPYLVCLTTSQQKKWRSKQPGCHSDKNYYFVDGKQDNFKKDTWIDFSVVYTLDVARLLNSCLKDGTYRLFELDITFWKALKKSISKS
jgi:predicted transcriptional regulator of viral defense system